MTTNDAYNEILEKADIVDVVSDYIKLEKAGSSYKGLCPFHNDSNPSFFVSPSKKICRCMVCGEGGNAVTILEKLAKISHREAIERLAERYQIKVNIKNDKVISSKKGLFQITNYAANFYNYYLTNSLPGKEALKYLYDRDLNDDIIKTFKIGLAPTGKNTLYLSLKDQGYSDSDMLKAGVIVGSDNIHDTFTNRIMFPITDEENNYIGFSGRIYYESNDSKYFNSLDNELFKKGRVIYNLFNALDSIRKNKRMIIMEGFMDVIASYRADLKECVCLMGTAMTKDHIEIIKKYNCEVILCLDGDDAGQNATYRILDLLQTNGINAYSVILSDNLDPDEYIKKYGKEQFRDIFEKELIDSYTFRYEYLKKKHNLDNIIGAQDFENNVFEMIRKSKNQVILEKFINKLSTDLNVEVKNINNDFSRFLQTKRMPLDTNVKEIKNNDCINGFLLSYETLIRYMMLSKTDLDRINYSVEQIEANQARYIPDFRPTQLITLIYEYYGFDPDDKYFYYYFDFISKIQVYFKSNKEMDLDKFYEFLTPNLQEFYNDKIKNIIISTDPKKKQKQIVDCYNKLTCFIIRFGIKRFKELMVSDELNSGYYSDQLIRLKKELIAIEKK